jgi:hypothetical protein
MTVQPNLCLTGIAARVGGGGPAGGSSFLGTLAVYPDRIIFTPSASAINRLITGSASLGQIVHTSKDVVLIKSRLMPPWYNSAIVLAGDRSLGEDRTAALGMTFLERRRLGRLLRDLGFHVSELQSWGSLGGSGSRWELPPQRRKR